MSKKLAIEAFNSQGKSILIDVIKNKVLAKSGNIENDVKCKASAIEKGFFVDSCQEVGGKNDVVALFTKHFDMKNDSLFFITTLAFITLAHYIGGYSEILSGIGMSFY